MLFGTIHLDPLAAIGQHFAHCAAFQPLAVLIDDGGGQRGAAGNRAAVGRDLAEQQLDQCRFAGTIGADDADAITLADAQGEIIEDGAITERQRYALGVDQDL